MAPWAQIIVPGLFDLPAGELDSEFLRGALPVLNQLLRFGTAQPNRHFTLDALIGDALFAQPPTGTNLPLAGLCREDPRTDDSHALLLEAVHLHADLNAALLLPIAKDQRNLQDINIIINDLSELFKVDCDITEIADGTYSMILRDFPAPTNYPHPLSVLGKAANPYIEQSRANLPWYRLLNEMQMFLHQHARNAERARDGLMTINSLWCWGGGSVDSEARTATWFCDDPLLRRLPQQLGLETQPLAAFAADSDTRERVYVDLGLLEALKGRRDLVLKDWLLEFDRSILAPAVEGLRRQGGSLTLRAAGADDYRLGARDRFRFWRAERALSELLAPD